MKTFFACMLTLLLLAGCATQSDQPAANPADAGDAPVAPTPKTETQTAAVAEPDTRASDPAVEKLFTRNSQVKSYKFDLAELPDRRGSHTYYVKGDTVFVDPITDIGAKDQIIEKVYLDLSAKTATGYCSEGRACDQKNAPIDLDFAEYNIVYPHEWIEQVKYGRKVTSLTFENKPVTVVRYEADGKFYEAYVDNYFGYPVRIAIASDAEMTNIIGGYEYRAMAFNTVTDADVTFTPDN